MILWLLIAVATILATLSPALAEQSSAFKEEVEQIVKAYIEGHPEILLEAIKSLKVQKTAELQERRRTAMLTRQAQLFDDPASPSAGNVSGSIRVVEFFDYKCSYCKAMTRTVNDLALRQGDVKVIYKEFPILGPESLLGAKAALAADRQNSYPRFHSGLMQLNGNVTMEAIEALAGELKLDVQRLKADMESQELLNVISQNRQLANALGITSTPTFIIETEVVTGLLSPASMDTAIAKVKDAKGKTQ